MQGLPAFITKQPKWLAALEALLLLGAVAWLDLVTGYRITLAAFYSIPILFAVVACDRETPFGLAFLSCVAWSWADSISGHEYINPWIHAWEISVRCFFFFAVAAAGVAFKDRQQANQERFDAVEYASRLERDINELSEHEQQRIGRELHDGLSQYLAAISCAVTALRMDLEKSGRDRGAAAATQIEKLLADAVNQARDLSRNLAPVRNEDAGLSAALQELAAATSRRYGVDVTFEAAGANVVSVDGKATHLFRIAQEAIENAVKHSHARSIDIRLSANESVLSLSVADNGRGIGPEEHLIEDRSLGVINYRAKIMGGEVEVEQVSRGGTVLSCTVPQTEEFV